MRKNKDLGINQCRNCLRCSYILKVMLKTPETAVHAESNKTLPVEKIKIGTLILDVLVKKFP